MPWDLGRSTEPPRQMASARTPIFHFEKFQFDHTKGPQQDPPPDPRDTGTRERRLPSGNETILKFKYNKENQVLEINQEIVYTNVIEFINIPNPKNAKNGDSERQG